MERDIDIMTYSENSQRRAEGLTSFVPQHRYGSMANTSSLKHPRRQSTSNSMKYPANDHGSPSQVSQLRPMTSTSSHAIRFPFHDHASWNHGSSPHVSQPVNVTSWQDTAKYPVNNYSAWVHRSSPQLSQISSQDTAKYQTNNNAALVHGPSPQVSQPTNGTSSQHTAKYQDNNNATFIHGSSSNVPQLTNKTLSLDVAKYPVPNNASSTHVSQPTNMTSSHDIAKYPAHNNASLVRGSSSHVSQTTNITSSHDFAKYPAYNNASLVHGSSSHVSQTTNITSSHDVAKYPAYNNASLVHGSDIPHYLDGSPRQLSPSKNLTHNSSGMNYQNNVCASFSQGCFSLPRNITSFSSDDKRFQADNHPSEILVSSSQVSRPMNIITQSSEAMKNRPIVKISWIQGSSSPFAHPVNITSSSSHAMKNQENIKNSRIQEPSSQFSRPMSVTSASSDVMKNWGDYNVSWTRGSSLQFSQPTYNITSPSSNVINNPGHCHTSRFHGSPSQGYQSQPKTGMWSYIYPQESDVRTSERISFVPRQEREKSVTQYFSREGEFSPQSSFMAKKHSSYNDARKKTASNYSHHHGRYTSAGLQQRTMVAPSTFTPRQHGHTHSKASSGYANDQRSLHEQQRASEPTVIDMYPTGFASQQFSGPNADDTRVPLQSSAHLTETGQSHGPLTNQNLVHLPPHNDQASSLKHPVRKVFQTPKGTRLKAPNASNVAKSPSTNESHDFPGGGSQAGFFPNQELGHKVKTGLNTSETVRSMLERIRNKKGATATSSDVLPSVGVGKHTKTNTKSQLKQHKAVKGSDKQTKPSSTLKVKQQNPERKHLPCSVSKAVQLLTDFRPLYCKLAVVTCEICEKKYRHLAQLEEHLSEHMDVWTVKCSLCVSRFTHQKYLNFHMENHKQSQYLVCDVCGRSFANSQSFKRHRRNKHGLSKLQCFECGLLYVGKYAAHCKNKHKGYARDDEEGYSCEVCSRRFKYRSRLDTHKKIHTMKKTSLCAYCGKIFKSRESLSIHSKKHDPNYEYKVQCTICDKMVDKLYLYQHKKNHSLKRNFKCEECGHSFLMKHHLTTHMKSHSDERPYVCDICQASFKLPHRLRAHRKTHGDDVEA